MGSLRSPRRQALPRRPSAPARRGLVPYGAGDVRLPERTRGGFDATCIYARCIYAPEPEETRRARSPRRPHEAALVHHPRRPLAGRVRRPRRPHRGARPHGRAREPRRGRRARSRDAQQHPGDVRRRGARRAPLRAHPGARARGAHGHARRRREPAVPRIPLPPRPALRAALRRLLHPERGRAEPLHADGLPERGLRRRRDGAPRPGRDGGALHGDRAALPAPHPARGLQRDPRGQVRAALAT